MSKNIVRVALQASLGILLCLGASAQTQFRRPAIAQSVDEMRLITLPGNTHPLATAQNDRGRADDNLQLDHLLLQLKRSPEQDEAARRFLDEQQNPQSPNYHQWLTAQQFGERFGVTDQDIATVTHWLGSHGFVVNQVHPNRMLIDYSGTAGQVAAAFHTEIHVLDVGGARHIGNLTNPRIPAAFGPVVEGIVSLHDFMPHPLAVPRSKYTYTSGGFTTQAVVPGDLATIYDFNPAFNVGYTGRSQVIVVVEDTNLFTATDFTTFRSTFGLTSRFPSGNLVTLHPAGPGGNCSNPGVNGDDAEAAIDVEWATAAAPNATIVLASCANTVTQFGGFIALQNLLALANPPAVVSVSYGETESELGASGNAYINSLYQTAASEGVSVFVSSGDEGAASSDAGATTATHGITVSGFATTPYNVAVGGTDFADTYLNTNSAYWSSTNGPAYNSALSYIPETPWNDSCASKLLATVLGFTTTYGASGLCASSTASQDGLLLPVGGSGGPSACATGNPARPGFVGGTCQGYPKPSWQSIFGNPSDGVRDIPDVSLFAANGLWGHYYVVCYSDTARGGAPCTGAPSSWAGFGGTSVSAPIMAGIQALLNQKTGLREGNPNPHLYQLGRAMYGPSGNNACDSLGTGRCIFHDVTLGDIDVNCKAGSPNCYDPGNVLNGGVLSTSTTSYAPAYGTTKGWDFSTGIGTVDVALLLTYWP